MSLEFGWNIQPLMTVNELNFINKDDYEFDYDHSHSLFSSRYEYLAIDDKYILKTLQGSRGEGGNDGKAGKAGPEVWNKEGNQVYISVDYQGHHDFCCVL